MRIRLGNIVPLIATVSFGAALVTAPSASADTSAPVRVACVGVTNDVAGYVSGAPKSSRDILGLAASIVGLPGLPPFPTTVTTDAPDKLAVDSGDRDITVTYQILVPTQVASLLRDNLGVQSIVAQNVVAGVQATAGPVTATVSAITASAPLDLNNPASAITVSMKVKISTAQSGRIFFRPTPITMDLQINGAVGSIATVGTAKLECDVQGVIASTAVQVKGTPNTPAVVDGPTVQGGQTATIPLLGRPDFLEDDGNPILPESLRITKAAGGATIVDGALVQPTSIEGGTYTNEVELCGAPRQTADVPGINEIQALTFPSYAHDPTGLFNPELFNPHPLGMQLSFKGEETAEIPLTTLAGTWLEGLDPLFGKFKAPDPKTIESALVALPSVEPGDITVTRESDGSYRFAFAGKLGESDQPKLELSDWRTQLDYSAYEEIQAAVRGLTGGGSGDSGGSGGSGGGTPDPSATSLNLDQLTAQLQAGQISLDSYLAKFGSALKNSVIQALPISAILTTLEEMFPQKPEIAQRDGESPIPGSSTGPLCTNFIVQTVATPTEIVVAKSVRVAPPCRVSGRIVKHRVKVRRTVRGHKRTRYRTVKVVRTLRTGGCPQAIVMKSGKITISNLPIHRSSITRAPKRVTITVTASGVAGKTSKSFTVSKKTASASGVIQLPASLAGAKRLTIRISGKGVASGRRTLLPS